MKKIYSLLFILSVSCNYLLAQVEGTWKLAPEELALAVGPDLGSSEWWASSVDDVSVRACYFDDEYVFNADGTFQNILGNETWLEAWQGIAADACGAPIAPHDGTADAAWAYDADAGTLTLDGLGAYIGLPKVINAAEIDNPANAASSITYDVSIDGDRMTLDINFGPGFWRYVLVKTGSSNVTELAENQFSIYPNPATSEVTIQSEAQIEELYIRDITGKVVAAKQNLSLTETINTSGFSTGMYIVEARTGNQVSIEKLIVN